MNVETRPEAQHPKRCTTINRSTQPRRQIVRIPGLVAAHRIRRLGLATQALGRTAAEPRGSHRSARTGLRYGREGEI